MRKTSPISNLNDDTLLSVFDIITSKIPHRHATRKDRPLVTVKNSSQVCRRWRGLLLGSPWIWARVVDLNGFVGRRATKGLEEISGRAGSAPLWIHGTVMTQGDKMECFIRLLDSWERVEKLAVDIHATNDGPIPEGVQGRFLSPAPMLKIFDVSFLFNDHILFLETFQDGSSQSLFANYAPSLRTMGAVQVAYRLDSPWLSNIREITVPKNLSLNDIFILLQHTPVIETIILRFADLTWQPTHPPPYNLKLNLPHLSAIIISANLPAVARMLEYISPGNLSALSMEIFDSPSQTAELNDPSFLSSFKKNLARYITNYFTANSSQSFKLEMIENNFQFSDVTTKISNFDMADFEITARSYALQSWDNMIICLLDAFILSLGAGPSIVESVTRMTLPTLQVQSSVIRSLYSFLTVFRHVRNIETWEGCGHALYNLSHLDQPYCDPKYVLFPELHTLQLCSIVHGARRFLGNHISAYLRRRKILGFPVAMLDLTSCTSSYYAQDLRELEDLDGLEVVWRERRNGFGEVGEICSYICGSGNPEQLRGLVNDYEIGYVTKLPDVIF